MKGAESGNSKGLDARCSTVFPITFALVEKVMWKR
jgi:hypothetical protein